MPLGLPSGVIQPSASGSPGWVQHLVNTGVTIWSNHPIQAASATVWIQVGIGFGCWSHHAAGGLGSGDWRRSVGASWSGPSARRSAASSPLGRRGSSGSRCGPLLLPRRRPHRPPRTGLRHRPSRPRRARTERALPHRHGRTPGLAGKRVLARRWDARRHGPRNARTQQPGFLSSWVSSFASLVAAHGWAVNLFVVLALATIGGLLLSGRRPRPRRWPGVALPRRLGPRGRSGLLRWVGHRPEFHAADGPHRRRRIRGDGPSAGCHGVAPSRREAPASADESPQGRNGLVGARR